MVDSYERTGPGQASMVGGHTCKKRTNSNIFLLVQAAFRIPGLNQCVSAQCATSSSRCMHPEISLLRGGAREMFRSFFSQLVFEVTFSSSAGGFSSDFSDCVMKLLGWRDSYVPELNKRGYIGSFSTLAISLTHLKRVARLSLLSTTPDPIRVCWLGP